MVELKEIMGVGFCGEKNKDIVKIGIRVDMLDERAQMLQRYG